MKCLQGYEVHVMKSTAGYFLGTTDEIGAPNCRLTTKYAKTMEEAERLALDRQNASENRFCNGCGKCFK